MPMDKFGKNFETNIPSPKSPENKLTATVAADELWFLNDRKKDFESRSIYASLRLGNREFGTEDPKGGYKKNEFIKIRLHDGNQNFDPEEFTVLVTDVEQMAFDEISQQELAGNPELQKDAEELSKFYRREIKADEPISIIRFEYMDNLKTIQDLVDRGLLKIGVLPKANPDNLNFPRYTVPLMQHDYPALTAVMWNKVYAELGMPDGNIMIEADPKQAQQILEVLRKDPKYLGGGQAVGFKDESIKFLDEIDPMAKAIGSINFIRKTPEDKLRGTNTDGIGFAVGLEQKFQELGKDLSGKKALILGAGGTAPAVAFALADKGMSLVILTRSVEAAQQIAERVNTYFGKDIASAGGEDLIESEALQADAIVNVSLKGANGQLQEYSALAAAKLPATIENIAENQKQSKQIFEKLGKGVIVSDINLLKGLKPTQFLKTAEQFGLPTVDGVPMVVNQGVESFWILYASELEPKGITKQRVFEIMNAAAQESRQ